ncbi:hypothetical protein GCM10009650_03140 [Nesterenkonia jeotgali]
MLGQALREAQLGLGLIRGSHDWQGQGRLLLAIDARIDRGTLTAGVDTGAVDARALSTRAASARAVDTQPVHIRAVDA